MPNLTPPAPPRSPAATKVQECLNALAQAVEAEKLEKQRNNGRPPVKEYNFNLTSKAEPVITLPNGLEGTVIEVSGSVTDTAQNVEVESLIEDIDMDDMDNESDNGVEVSMKPENANPEDFPVKEVAGIESFESDQKGVGKDGKDTKLTDENENEATSTITSTENDPDVEQTKVNEEPSDKNVPDEPDNDQITEKPENDTDANQSKFNEEPSDDKHNSDEPDNDQIIEVKKSQESEIDQYLAQHFEKLNDTASDTDDKKNMKPPVIPPSTELIVTPLAQEPAVKREVKRELQSLDGQSRRTKSDNKTVTSYYGKSRQGTTGTSNHLSPSVKEQLHNKQKKLMDESGKMLEYLRKEVMKLRSQNSELRSMFDSVKKNNDTLVEANESAGASFASLNDHAKQMMKTNATLQEEILAVQQEASRYKSQAQSLSVAHMELKEELKLKKESYNDEVQTRLRYQKTMTRIVDAVQERCRQHRLVEDVLAMSDECVPSDEDMEEPTNHPSPEKSPKKSPEKALNPNDGGFSSRLKSFWKGD